MHPLPVEVLETVTAFLNPTERWRLSATSRRYRKLLPVPLRIKIVSHHSASVLAPRFYVSRVKFLTSDPNDDSGPSSSSKDPGANSITSNRATTIAATFLEGATLKAGEELQNGVDYLFWTYDYNKEQKVYLGRHGQNILYNNLRHNHGISTTDQQIEIINDEGNDNDDQTNDNDGDETMDEDIDEEPIANDDDDRNSDRPNCLYTLGLQARTPNQTWRIVRGDSSSTSSFQTSAITAAPHIVGLTVGGTVENSSFRPDSNQRMFLSSQWSKTTENSDFGKGQTTERYLWYCLKESRCFDSDQNGQSEVVLQKEECMSIIPCGPENDEFVSQRQQGQQVRRRPVLSQRDLMIHSAPDIMDHGYYLYSPQSLEEGPAIVEVYHAKLHFHFWIKRGYMFFEIVNESHEASGVKAMDGVDDTVSVVHQLDFTFAVPILEEDCMEPIRQQQHQSNGTYARDCCRPLKKLMGRNSSRWWSIKHFMSNAADAKEGRPFIMADFLSKVKDHDDHVIVHDPASNLVYIYVKNAVVDTGFPDCPRHATPWQFVLCG